MHPLTERQQAVLHFICRSIQDDGYPPTLREIGNHLGIRSTNGVNDHLRALVKKGYLTRHDMKSRALCPTPEAFRLGDPTQPADDPNRFPGLTNGHNGGLGTEHTQRYLRGSAVLPSANGSTSQDDDTLIPILGRVAAGLPTEAIELREDAVHIERVHADNGREVFGLRVRGDAMTEAGIHNGDYVLVRKQLSAQSGEIVVAIVDGEATCKYYYPEDEHVRLQSASDRVPPIFIPHDEWRSTQLLGVVIAMYRRLM